jgi:hypothetical protein
MDSRRVARSTFVTVVAWIFIVLSAFTSVVAVMQNVRVWTMDFPSRRRRARRRPALGDGRRRRRPAALSLRIRAA